MTIIDYFCFLEEKNVATCETDITNEMRILLFYQASTTERGDVESGGAIHY